MIVVNIGQLVTVSRPDLGIIRDAAMSIRGSRITAVGPMSERCDNGEIVDAMGGVVTPGFVDAHTHPVFAGTRVDEYEQRAAGMTYQEIAAAGGGIRSTVKLTRAATEDQLLASASRYVQWFLRSGTTTIEAKSGYGLTLADELKLLRVIRGLPLRHVSTFLGAHEIPDEYRDRPDDYADLIVHEMIPAVAEQHLAEFCDVFCEPSVFNVPIARRILTAARDAGLGLRIHADQLERSGGAQLAAELHAKTADHLEYADTADIAALKKANVQPVLLPASVYALGLSKFPPAREMIDAGLAVVLATDFNPGSSPTTSMPLVLSLASTHMRMTPAEAIAAATSNAARSLNRGHEIGSLEPGKLADFVIWDCKDYREIAYFAGVDLIKDVYAGGILL